MKMRRPSARIVTLAACVALPAVGAALGAGAYASRVDRMQPPAPVPTCVRVVAGATGEAAWFCGATIRIPNGARVITSDIAPCARRNGFGGPIPCYWDAVRHGPGGSVSFTILPAGDPVGGLQPVLFRYNDGVTRLGEVPTS